MTATCCLRTGMASMFTYAYRHMVFGVYRTVLGPCMCDQALLMFVT